MLIEVKNLKKHFKVKGNKTLRAVDGVSFAIEKGQTLGLVGESGCGKSTLGRTIVNLYNATEGEIIYKGENITKPHNKQKLELAKKIQMIFQDPYASLNPRMTVGDIIGEGIDIHGLLKGAAKNDKIFEILEKVGLNREHVNRFPHEFSGGQRQRIGIARSLAIDPEFIVCDEPISALDVSIQAQIINLMGKLQRELGLTYLFIAHDINMVAHISDRIAVMYLGKIMEIASSEDIMNGAIHPYTKALLSAAPFADPKESRMRERIRLEGDVPNPMDKNEGCKFCKRCSLATEKCITLAPELLEVRENHFVACHYATV